MPLVATMWPMTRRLLQLYAGLLLYGLSMALQVRATLGLGPWDVFHEGVADHTGFPENAAYAASKYGLRGLHETLSAEYRGTGVRLTLVSPGATDTTIWDPFAPERRPGFPPRAAMLRPEDVADAVLFAATRPEHVHVDWIRLQPSGRPANITTPTSR